MRRIELDSFSEEGAVYIARTLSGVEQGRIALDFNRDMPSQVTLRNITTRIRVGFIIPKYEDYGGQGIGTELLFTGMKLSLSLGRVNLDATYAPEKDYSVTEEWYRNRKIFLKRNGHDLFGYVPAIVGAARRSLISICSTYNAIHLFRIV